MRKKDLKSLKITRYMRGEISTINFEINIRHYVNVLRKFLKGIKSLQNCYMEFC